LHIRTTVYYIAHTYNTVLYCTYVLVAMRLKILSTLHNLPECVNFAQWPSNCLAGNGTSWRNGQIPCHTWNHPSSGM